VLGMENMTLQEIIQFVQSIGLGGAGWMLAIVLYQELKALRGMHIELLQEQKKEAVERTRLLEQRLFDIQSHAPNHAD